MSDQSQKEYILSENLWKVMWTLSWPAVIAMVLYGLNMVFDAVFVGRFVGEDALAGVSIAYPLSSLTLGLGSLIGVGAGSFLSIALGANNYRGQSRLMGNVNALTMIISVAYTAAGLVFAEPLIRMMGGEGQALELGIRYFRTTAVGSVLWIYGLTLNMIVRAEGKMKTAAVMMGIGLVVNIVCNYLLVVVLDLGVAGAAWGTNIGMGVYVLTGLLYFSGKRASFASSPFQIHMDSDILKSILSMGMSSLIMSVMFLLQSAVVYNALARYGSTFDVAFYGSVYRVFNLLMTPIFGLMRALQPVVGINFGARNNDRVIRSVHVFFVASVAVILPFWIVVMAMPTQVIGTMMPQVALSAEHIVSYRVFISILPLLPAVFLAMTFFPSIGKGGPAAVIGVVRQLVFYVPVMLTLPRLFGIRWVYFGSFLIDVVIVIAVVLLFVRESGKLRSDKTTPAPSAA